MRRPITSGQLEATAEWAVRLLCVAVVVAGTVVVAGAMGQAVATERGWTATIITGAIPVKQGRPAKPAAPVADSEEARMVAVPVIEAQSTQATGATSGARTAALPAADARPAQQYCVNIANAAADARLAWQKKTIADLERELDERIARLQAKTAEYEQWLARRDEFSKRAQEQLVGIFARMQPDAAAPQLEASDEETAAAVLSKLDVRISSAILSEMDPRHAARLAAIIAGSAKVTPAKSARSVPDGKRS